MILKKLESNIINTEFYEVKKVINNVISLLNTAGVPFENKRDEKKKYSQDNLIFLAGELNNLENKKTNKQWQKQEWPSEISNSKNIDSDEIHAIEIKILDAQK